MIVRLLEIMLRAALASSKAVPTSLLDIRPGAAGGSLDIRSIMIASR